MEQRLAEEVHMVLTRHQSASGPQWALAGRYLPQDFRLAFLLSLSKTALFNVLSAIPTAAQADAPLLPPIEPTQEVWASGVTYRRSRDARQAESNVGDVYERVYDAQRPELFFKSVGWRVAGHGQPVRIRRDSQWDVPEPELTLVVNAHQEIVGYCAGNDLSSRSIEGENPLYLPQAKTYDGSCGLGAGLRLGEALTLDSISIQMQIIRDDVSCFAGETNSSQMKRTPRELVSWLYRQLSFPQGVFLMTGTGLVPEEAFTLQAGDRVRITVAEQTLENWVEMGRFRSVLFNRATLRDSPPPGNLQKAVYIAFCELPEEGDFATGR
jgi:2-dehydro-3-deoxy-D-arabinonate dehydratase